MCEKISALIIDDDESQLDFYREYLSIIGTYKIDSVGNVVDTKSLLANHDYDIILLDYKLPDGNGIDILNWMSAQGYQTPVIMITGQGDEEIAAQSIQCGASDYLVKGERHFANLQRLIQKNIDAYKLKLSYERSLEQIRYQALLLSNVRDAIVVWDTNGKITYWNRAAEMLYHKRAASCIGKSVSEHYLNKFQPEIIPPRPQDTSQMNIERQLINGSDEPIWVSSRVSILRDYENDGALMGYIDVTRDITERHRMDAQIQNSQTQLIQAARLAAIGELAAGVAHQINNPLTTVIAESQLVKNQLPENHVAQESIEAIEQAGWKTQEAVQQLLSYSRPASMTIVSTSVNATITRALAIIGNHILSSGTAVKTELQKNLPAIKANQQQLEDLWINLLLLARDATIDGNYHTIWIRSMLGKTGNVIVEIEDDGKPIPPEKLDVIFEPNFVDQSLGRGTGMELSICREIVRQHHGQIKARRVGEKGTKMLVSLPQEKKL